jgi:hypothetical protein
MKKYVHKLFALLLTVFALSTAHANDRKPGKPAEESRVVPLEKFAYSVYARKDQLKFRLAFENTAAERVTVRIFDRQNRLVHTDVMRNQTGLKRDYNLEALGKGEYQMSIVCGEFSATNRLFVGTKPVEGKFGAYLSNQLKDGKMQLAFQNASDDVYITLTDAQGTIHYSEHLVGEVNFARRYDLSRLRPGEYTMSITTGDKTVEQAYKVGK